MDEIDTGELRRFLFDAYNTVDIVAKILVDDVGGGLYMILNQDLTKIMTPTMYKNFYLGLVANLNDHFTGFEFIADDSRIDEIEHLDGYVYDVADAEVMSLSWSNTKRYRVDPRDMQTIVEMFFNYVGNFDEFERDEFACAELRKIAWDYSGCVRTSASVLYDYYELEHDSEIVGTYPVKQRKNMRTNLFMSWNRFDDWAKRFADLVRKQFPYVVVLYDCFDEDWNFRIKFTFTTQDEIDYHAE